MALESLLNIFGRDKDQLFDVLVCVFSDQTSKGRAGMQG